MKRLWKYIPPCLSDVMGFQAVMNETEGLGIIDDPSRYKPLPTLGAGGGKPAYMGFGGGRGEFGGSRPDKGGFEGDRGRFGGPGGHGGFTGRGGHGPGGRGGAGQRVVDSELRNEDIISGTEKKVVQAYENAAASLNPHFVLLSNAPSSAMISSDLESAADKISEIGGIPASNVKIYGDKDYLFGVSMTLEALGKLLLSQADRKPRSVNILGCNTIDWSEDTVNALTNELEAAGITVLSKWGAKGMTTASLKSAAEAALNLVVNISGMRLARFMESEFGIPYIAMAPFGLSQLEEIKALAEKAFSDPAFESGVYGIDRSAEAAEDTEVLVIGEQLQANAIRSLLKSQGYNNVRVISFYEMDKEAMEAGDKKISGEDELAAICANESIKLIFGNPDYRMASKRDTGNDIRWIDLPNSGMSMITRVEQVNMTGAALDEWISAGMR